MMTTQPRALLDLTNDILTQAGQSAVGSLQNPVTPVRQVLSFLNQTYRELRTMLQAPPFQTLRDIPYAAQSTGIDLLANAIDPTRIVSGCMWVKPSTPVDATFSPLDYVMVNPFATRDDQASIPYQVHFSQTQAWLFPRPTVSGIWRIAVETPVPRLILETEVPLLPGVAEEGLIFGTLALLQQFLGDTNGAQVSFARYDQERLKLKGRMMKLRPLYRMRGYMDSP
jgi:hypothetical protein